MFALRNPSRTCRNPFSARLGPTERLTQVRESLGSGGTLKTFTWSDATASLVTPPGSGAACTNYTRGKLVGQSRFNYVMVGGSPFGVEIREVMTYCGRDGRLSAQTLENRVNGAMVPNESFLWPSWTYDALGNVSTFAYPQRSHAACTALSPRTPQNTYDQGLLQQVGVVGAPNRYANSITYHPQRDGESSRSREYAVQYRDLGDGHQHPRRVRHQSPRLHPGRQGGSPLWSTGAYAYEGAGNIKSIAQLPLVHDKVSRLVGANFRLETIRQATGQTRNKSSVPSRQDIAERENPLEVGSF